MSAGKSDPWNLDGSDQLGVSDAVYSAIHRLADPPHAQCTMSRLH